MGNLKLTRPFYKLTVFIALIINTAATSQSGPSVNQNGDPVKLSYHYPTDKPVKYVYITKVIQNMEVNGNPVHVNVATYLECSVRSSDYSGTNVRLEISLDSMAHTLETPQGETGGVITEAKDKVFKILISPSGKAIDLSEAAKILLNPPGRRETDVSETFLNYFPLLPPMEVSKGDSWIINDTIDTKNENMSRWMPVESKCKFEGIEKLNDFDCAKIFSRFSGTMKTVTQSQGMDVNTTGRLSGTKTLYFAIKEGFFVREIISSTMRGTVEIPDQNMSIPVVMDINSTNEFVKP